MQTSGTGPLFTPMNLRSGATTGGSPEPQSASPALTPIPALHGIDASIVYGAVDTSLHEAAQTLSTESLVGMDAVRQIVHDLASASNIDPMKVSTALTNLGAIATTTDTGRDALQRMATASKSMIAGVLAAHNEDLSDKQQLVESLEASFHVSLMERDSAVQKEGQALMNISLIEQRHKNDFSILEKERDSLRDAPFLMSTSACAAAASATSSAAMHTIWQKLDPLIASKDRAMKRERQLVESQLEKWNGAADNGDTDTVLASILATTADTTEIETAIASVGKTIRHMDKCIDNLMSEFYSLPPADASKHERKLQESESKLYKSLTAIYETQRNRETGLKFAQAIWQCLLQHPRQTHCLLPCWRRIIDEYTSTTKPSDFSPPSRFKLDRGGAKDRPEWVESTYPDCSEGIHTYSEAFERTYMAQNELLYGILQRMLPQAAEEAKAGSAHGRYDSGRVIFISREGEGLALLNFFVQKHRMVSWGDVAALEMELAQSYTILAKDRDMLANLREWRQLATRGMALKLRVKYSSLIYRSVTVLKSKYPSELAEICARYLVTPPPRYEEDSLSLVHLIAADAEGVLLGYKNTMSGMRSSDPRIRARRAWDEPKAPPTAGSRRPGSMNFGARQGGRRSDKPREPDVLSKHTCSNPRCTQKVATKAIKTPLKHGEQHTLLCFDCWKVRSKDMNKTQTQGRRNADTRVQAFARQAHEDFSSKSHRSQRQPQRRDRQRDQPRGRGRGRGGGRDTPAWMQRRNDLPAHARNTHQAFRTTVRRSPATGANTTPVARTRDTQRAQRDGYLDDVTLYMVRVVTPTESLVESMQDTISTGFKDTRRLLQCPCPPQECSDVRCNRATAAMVHEGTLLMTILLDSGASSNIFSSAIDCHLQNAIPSNAKISGFDSHAPSVKAAQRGQLNIYFMQALHPTLADPDAQYCEKGMLSRIQCDTVPAITDSLLSFTELHHQGYSLRLINEPGKRECTIERVDPDTGKTHIIPLFYDKTRRGFVAHVCVGRNSGLVHKRGRATERKLQTLSLDLGRAASLSDLGFGYTSGKPPYAVEATDLCMAARAMDQILPASVHVCTEVNGQQLYGPANTLTKLPYKDESLGMGPNISFQPQPRIPAAGLECIHGFAGAPPLQPVLEEDDAVDLRHLLHCGETIAENYCFMNERATHPYEAARKDRDRKVVARPVRMQTDGPLGYAQISGARTLAESQEAAPPRTPTGDTPDAAIIISSSSSSNAHEPDDDYEPGSPTREQAQPRAPKTPARRRLTTETGGRPPRALPPGLAAAAAAPAHAALLYGARITGADKRSLVEHEREARAQADRPDKQRRRSKSGAPAPAAKQCPLVTPGGASAQASAGNMGMAPARGRNTRRLARTESCRGPTDQVYPGRAAATASNTMSLSSNTTSLHQQVAHALASNCKHANMSPADTIAAAQTLATSMAQGQEQEHPATTSDLQVGDNVIVAMPTNAVQQTRRSPMPMRARAMPTRTRYYGIDSASTAATRGGSAPDLNTAGAAAPSHVPGQDAITDSDGAGLSNDAESTDGDSPHPRRSLPGDEPTGTPLDDFVEDYDIPAISGTKRGLNDREKRQTIAHLHRRFGHIGHKGDSMNCALCQMMGGSFNRRAHARSRVPADPELPGFRWAVDVVYMTTPAISGELYACIMRDCCTGFYSVAYDRTKSFGRHIVHMIQTMRAKPHFQGYSYPIFSELRSDHDGSWFLEADTQRELDELGVTCVWGSPGSTDDHRAHCFAEAAVRFLTHTTKMILLQSRLPTSYWKFCMEQAVQIRNLFPLRKYAQNVYSGDAIRPLEQLTRSRVSRTDCNQLLSAMCSVGSLNLVHQAQLNSTDLGTPTARWGVCVGMMGKVAVFKCPFAGAKSTSFYSRNWMGLELPAGMGFHAALNITPRENEVAPPGVTIPPCDRDVKLKNVIVIPNLSALTAAQRRVWSPVVSLKTGKLQDGNTPSIIMINDEGVVYAHDGEGNITRTDQVLSLAQRAAPNTSIINHLHNFGVNIPRSLDEHRTFDPVVLMTDPLALTNQCYWRHFPEYGHWMATIRLYDPSAKTWTATFRDGTYEDLNMRELEIMMVDRPDDPNISELDQTQGLGAELLGRARQGPDTDGPLPADLIEELIEDLGIDSLKNDHGEQIPWSHCTVSAIQSALQSPERLRREGIAADANIPQTNRTSPPRMVQQQPRQGEHGHRGDNVIRPGATDVERNAARPVPLHIALTRKRGQTGRTRGLNPPARATAESIASKRIKPFSPSADGGVIPEADDDKLPWSETLFNWAGNGLPPPPPATTPYFEIDFLRWTHENLPTITACDETFKTLCVRLHLDPKESRLYWMWLGKFYSNQVSPQFSNDVTMCARRMPCPWGRAQRATLLFDGQLFPVPQGRLWSQILQQQVLKDNAGNTEHEDVRIARAYVTAIAVHERTQDAIVRATSNKTALKDVTTFMTDNSVHEQDNDQKGTQLRAMLAKLGGGVRRMAPTFATLGLIASIASGAVGEMDPRGYHPEAIWTEHQKHNQIHLDVNDHGMIQIYSKNSSKEMERSITCHKAKKSVQDAAKKGENPINPLTGRIRPPKSYSAIQGRPDAEMWLKAVETEMASLESFGVFHHNLTLDQCRKMGVLTSPVPLMITFDAKHTPLGTFDRAKARICVAGSPHWMKAGIHYGLTFAATPAHEITRILMALCVARGYARFQWDIKSAFMSTPIKPEDRIILRYPKGAERYDKQGRPLFAILDKVLYGVPSASRKFGKFLKDWILTRFSTGGYTVETSRSEPCLYIIKNKERRVIYLSIFTDDCQCVGPNINDLKEVGRIFTTKFEIKICDSQELLGVRRVIEKEKDGTSSMIMTQPGFLESTCKEFAPQWKKAFAKPKDTPFPPREMLSRSEIEDDATRAKAVHAHYMKEGSMSMTGCILWAARNTMPELSYGVSQLCRMMSTPTEKSYLCALHMISYMSTKIDRGIRFTQNGNEQLIGHYDSSLKPDPADSKCQYGFIFYWKNGPIAWASKKHSHVCLSTTQAEYQALAHAARTAVWLRTMFKEMGLGEYVKGPTILLGDCINAGNLCTEDKVTAQNRHILMNYHYAKEMYEIGEICPRRVTTKLNTSDVLTKANPKPDLDRLVPVLTGQGGELPPIPDLPRD